MMMIMAMTVFSCILAVVVVVVGGGVLGVER